MEAFFAAVEQGNLAAVEALLKTDSSLVAAKNEYGQTPLLNAAHYAGSGDCLKLLLSRGADVNSRNSLDSTPLHLVAVTGTVEAAKVLMGAGADVNAKNREGATPVTYAAEKKPDVLKVLLAHGGHASIEALTLAARHGRLESVKDLLECGAKVNPTSGGYSPLRWAACGWSDDHVKIAELLLAHGADPHVRDHEGDTPLACAEHNNQLPAMIELLRRHMKLPVERVSAPRAQSPTPTKKNQQAIAQLESLCSKLRQHIRSSGLAGPDGDVHPGICANIEEAIQALRTGNPVPSRVASGLKKMAAYAETIGLTRGDSLFATYLYDLTVVANSIRD